MSGRHITSLFRAVAAASALTAATLASAPAAAQDDPAGLRDAAVAAEMAAAARALIDAAQGPQPIAQMMGYSPAEKLHHTLDAEARLDWSFWPREREGLALGEMTAQQRVLAHELLETLLSARGYLEVQAIWSLEGVLAARETGQFPRGIEHYAFAVFGVPGTEEPRNEPWGWRVDGHHVSLNVTVVGDEIAVTPSFFGANPARVEVGELAGLEPLRYETAAGFALLDALDDRRRAQAIVSEEAPRDILSGQLRVPRESWDDWKEALAAEGLPSTDMTNEQRAALSRLVDEIVARYRPEVAAAERAAIDLDQLSFAWMGATAEGAPHYFRLVSGDFVYEYDATGPDGSHIHSVWRDKADDFGAGALARHYEAHPH